MNLHVIKALCVFLGVGWGVCCVLNLCSYLKQNSFSMFLSNRSHYTTVICFLICFSPLRRPSPKHGHQTALLFSESLKSTPWENFQTHVMSALLVLVISLIISIKTLLSYTWLDNSSTVRILYHGISLANIVDHWACFINYYLTLSLLFSSPCKQALIFTSS